MLPSSATRRAMATSIPMRSTLGSTSRRPGRPQLFPTVPCHRDTGTPAPLPPEPASQQVGIARLAASSSLADAKRGAEYYLLPARSILNRCDSERVPFTWTINPYRGCEFSCQYCYARYTHEYMDLDGGEFESKI